MPEANRPGLPRTVWALGFVSLLMDVSSEMIHALLPLFLTASLGASVALVGLIEGLAEATASIVKVVSGYLSDRFGRRKPLLLIGYGLAGLTKPLFAIAGAPSAVFAARLADRIGKGIRGSPRDALIADATPAEIRGRAYGLRQALDSTGAVAGPALALGLLALFADMRTVFWFAAVPAALAVLTLAFAVKEPAHPAPVLARAPIRLADLKGLNAAYWGVVAISAVFTLARFSEAFLILKANAEGLPAALAPLVLIVMNLVYALAAYPAGAWSDRAPARTLLAAGIGMLIAADLVLALADGAAFALVGAAFWGGHMALTQGLFAKLVAARAPEELRATAFGVFHCVSGIALLAASAIAGALWERSGADATFLAGAAFAAASLLLAPAITAAPPRSRRY